MANTNPVIPIEKVCDAMRSLSEMGIWGAITFNFEAGGVTKITDNFVWKAGDVEDCSITGPSEVIKKMLPAAKKKRMVIRAGT
jgi:hypothetical protein